jgi:hypothetical protein
MASAAAAPPCKILDDDELATAGKTIQWRRDGPRPSADRIFGQPRAEIGSTAAGSATGYRQFPTAFQSYRSSPFSSRGKRPSPLLAPKSPPLKPVEPIADGPYSPKTPPWWPEAAAPADPPLIDPIEGSLIKSVREMLDAPPLTPRTAALVNEIVTTGIKLIPLEGDDEDAKEDEAVAYPYAQCTPPALEDPPAGYSTPKVDGVEGQQP